MLKSSGILDIARTPGFFEVRDTALPLAEEVRVWLHRTVAMILYLAKRAKPELLTAVSNLATRVTKCSIDDIIELVRLENRIRGSGDMGLVLRPRVWGIKVHLFVVAAYGVHADKRSHTGNCVVIGDMGAVHCGSYKQQILTRAAWNRSS